MADIVLKTAEGVNVTHKNVNKIRVATADGGTVEFAHSSGGCGGDSISVTADVSCVNIMPTLDVPSTAGVSVAVNLGNS